MCFESEIPYSISCPHCSCSIIMHYLSVSRPLCRLLVISTVSAAAIFPPSQSLENQNIALPLDTPSQIGLLNTSALSLNASNLGAVRTQCNGARFGTHLNIDSCRTAIYYEMTAGPEIGSWGMRHDGHSGPDYNVPLPYRWLSRES